jgi:TPR repeat protein
MVLLAGSILQDENGQQRYPEAVQLFQRAMAQGSADAQYNLGVCFRRGLGVSVDGRQAEQHYREAAHRNHTSAQLALGDLIATRAATEADLNEASHWYQVAADAGNEVAKSRLARLSEARRAS